jgi:uncharacterized protein YecT (DUF1311 family)
MTTLRAAAACLAAILAAAAQPAAAQEIGPVWLSACLKSAWSAGDSGSRCIGRVARHCLDRPESDSTHGELACYRGEAAIWDGMLNVEYDALMSALDAIRAERVREAQRTWLRAQAVDCRIPMVLLEGSMAQPMIESCRMETTAERALMLRRWRLLIARE